MLPESPKATVRIAVDIGGTFTDAALYARGRTHVTKVLTTHDAPEQGFLAAMTQTLGQAGCRVDDLELIIHGTTLATNAIIERRGARIALLTTEGFRDVIEIADEGRYDQYDLKLVKPAPLVPRHRRYAVTERVDARGTVLCPLDEQAVRAIAAQMATQEVEAVAVCFLHAFQNPAHEQRAREILASALPGVSICLSAEVCPEIREYERFSTTCANAYVQPIMQGYLSRLSAQLVRNGTKCPLLLMSSGGGLASVETASRLPIRLIESGPAGGAILASELARSLALRHVLSFDMGGTTAKICLLDDGRPESARTFEVARTARFRKGSGLPLRIPVIELIEIGAGGGSIARLDRLGGIKVGPDSAESDPGPACYGRGAIEPTVTDADLVLGRIDAGAFAGGHMQLRPELAEAAIRARVGEPLGLDTSDAAYAICETIDETMANAARVYSVERGRNLSEHTIVAFGGAAPLHAARLAEKLGISQVIVPRNPGVGSALGFMCAPIAYEAIRSHYVPLHEIDAAAVNAIFSALRLEAMQAIGGIAGVTEEGCRERRYAYMRYVGQGHEMLVSLPARDLGDADADLLRTAFDQHYLRAFQRNLPGSAVELLTLALYVEAPNPLRLEALNATAPGEHGLDRGAVRAVRLSATDLDLAVPVYPRSALAENTVVAGPCIVVEPTTTTLVTSSFSLQCDDRGNLVLTRKDS